MEELTRALGRMARNKSTGLALYSADMLRDAHPSLYSTVARLFDLFASQDFPVDLNKMLLLPLYKGKGTKTEAKSYRPISLIHPLARWYAACLAARLERDTAGKRAQCQSGFREGYRVEDHVSTLQTMFDWARIGK